MTKLSTTLRTNAAYFAKQDRFFSNIINATNVQDAVDSVVFSANNPQKPANLNQVNVTAAMSPYLVGTNDYVIFCDTSAGPVTLNLPASASRGNLPIVIKDIGNNARNNVISAVPNGAETVDLQTPYVIDTNFGGAALQPKTATGGWTVLP